MSKLVLLTTLHLLGFSQIAPGGKNEGAVAVVDCEGDVTVELRIGNRFEVNAIIGPCNGSPVIPIWVVDYKAGLVEQEAVQDLWCMSILFDETHHDYEVAHDRLVELVDHLMELLAAPTSFSNLEMANPLTTQ